MTAVTVPAGTVVTDAPPESDEWFAARRGGITATDLPKILGLSKYGNARSVWHDKRGELPPEPAGEPAQWGHLLEDVVATEWSRRTGVGVRRVGVVRNGERPWMLAALDRLQDAPPDAATAALEVKTRSAYVASRWVDDLPDDVLAQVAWQRLVTGVDHVDVACLIGGQRLVEHRYIPDEQLEGFLLAAATEVWERVEDGTPPPVDTDSVLADLLDRLWPDRSGEVDVDTDLGSRLAAEYAAALDDERAAKRRKEAARAAVLDALGPGEVLTAGGVPLFTYRSQSRTAVDLDRTRKEHPDLHDRLTQAGLITATSWRALRATTRKRDDD